MSDEPLLEPPDPLLVEHLAADREVPAFDPTRALRLEARLLASIDAGTPPMDEHPPAEVPPRAAAPAASSAATGTTLGAKLAVVTGLVGFALGGVAGWVGHSALTPAPHAPSQAPMRAVAVERDAGMSSQAASAPSTVAVAPVAPTPSSSNEAEPTTTVALRRDAGRANFADAVDAGAGRDDELADENALITRAQSALARGRASEAMAAVREHQRRFPGGRFGEEREALAVQALARMGQHEAASERADRFFARYPRSLLTRAVRAAVAP